MALQGRTSILLVYKKSRASLRRRLCLLFYTLHTTIPCSSEGVALSAPLLFLLYATPHNSADGAAPSILPFLFGGWFIFLTAVGRSFSLLAQRKRTKRKGTPRSCPDFIRVPSLRYLFRGRSITGIHAQWTLKQHPVALSPA